MGLAHACSIKTIDNGASSEKKLKFPVTIVTTSCRFLLVVSHGVS